MLFLRVLDLIFRPRSEHLPFPMKERKTQVYQRQARFFSGYEPNANPYLSMMRRTVRKRLQGNEFHMPYINKRNRCGE